MVRFVVLFLTAGALSFLLTPLTRSFAIWAKIVDLPSERKIHNKPIPLLGGIPIFIFGFGIDSITNPASGKIIHLGIFSVPITILWVVLITNALNLVDGLDG